MVCPACQAGDDDGWKCRWEGEVDRRAEQVGHELLLG
jgi:hypothetical protein